MQEKHDKLTARRSILAGAGMAAAGLAIGVTSAKAQTSPTDFRPARHALDAWLDEAPGDHRVFIDSATANGGAEALLYANNLYIAQREVYAGRPADFAMVVCFRHYSTPFGYEDAVWRKYGEVFHGVIQFPDPVTGQAPRLNLMNSAAHRALPNVGVTIDALLPQGLEFVICSAATRSFARRIANAVGGSADAINDELVAGAIPNSRFVAAGVMALTRAQEYGYSLLYAG